MVLPLMIALFHEINGSNYKRRVSEPYVNRFYKLNMTTGLPEYCFHGSCIYYCYYLDFKSSVTLTMDGKTYKDPIFYCPYDASDIKFEPEDAEIYYTQTFDLSIDNGFESITSIYVATQNTTFVSPNEKILTELGYLYMDLVLAPIPGLTYTSSNVECEPMEKQDSCTHLVCMSFAKNYGKVTVGGSSSSNYTINRTISKRYSISFPSQGPYAFSGSDSTSGITTGAIAGIVIAALVVVCAAVFGIYYFLKTRHNQKANGNIQTQQTM